MSTRAWDKKACVDLHDYYIRGTIAQQYKCKRKDVPEEAVRLKKLIILYSRKQYAKLDVIMTKFIGDKD